MARMIQSFASNELDLGVLNRLGILQRVMLPIAFSIAGLTLFAWLVPSFAHLLPPAWVIMKANTALFVLASGLSLRLSTSRSSPRAVLASRLLGVLVLLLSAATIAEYAGHLRFSIDNILAADHLSLLPGRPSLQTSWSFFLISIVLINIRVRKVLASYLIDALTLGLVLLILTFFAGYLFGAAQLYGFSIHTRISPQTLFCLAVLTLLIFNRRAEYGVFAILLGGGIGGRTARVAAPWSICLPFILTGLRGLILRSNLMLPEYCMALSAATMAIFGFCLILILSRRSNLLEAAIRELSLRDELTGLYNRRGFYLLAEQSLLLSQRSAEPFSVLFIDMDHLKQINDAFGHEVGSELLQDMAAILAQTFRDSDVVGRVGGDEFVVAGRADATQIAIAADRLQDIAARSQPRSGRSNALSFSFGCVTSSGNRRETLAELLEQADSIMYQAKRTRKEAHPQPVLFATV